MLIGYEAAKRLEEQERRREHDQLQEDRRMAELLSQEFLVQQIVSNCFLSKRMFVSNIQCRDNIIL